MIALGDSCFRESVHLNLHQAEIRPWSRGDLTSLVPHANNRATWRQLRDRFHSPYTNAVKDGVIKAQIVNAAYQPAPFA